jgi:ATPase family protein associated with various cellular activities (AAA)
MLNLAKDTAIESRLDAFAFVLTGLARLANVCDTLDETIQAKLRALAARRIDGRKSLRASFQEYLRTPEGADAALAQIALRFHLDPIEALATRLAIAAEQDLLIGHLLVHLQQPLARGRPTVGLVAQAFASDDLHRAVHVLGQGNAVRCGLLQLIGDDNPLPERQIQVPLATALALEGIESCWPGSSPITFDSYPVPLGKKLEVRGAAIAKRLHVSGDGPALVIRSADTLEARGAAAHVCSHCRAHAIQLQTDQLLGVAPWLVLNDLLPVFVYWLAPGERKTVPVIPGFSGPVILLTGPDGEFQSDDRAILDWRLETPCASDRRDLWMAAIGDPALSDRLAREHRHSPGRIATLAAKAHEEQAACGSGDKLSYTHIRTVSRRGDSIGLGALAELIPDEVGDEALVVHAALRSELESLVTRCRLREEFPQSLGPSIRARYRPSVRALFVGPSGTGKTLAVSWLASRLGIPLFRVDLSAVTSKYIGETEKNLSQLLARAEQNEVLLLFDEADSLFGKRTDIHESNDRFANAQTNYLLQRMESYDGITVLTSNGRSRFDDAFSRRFDAILSFPPPGPEQRRALWMAHLGEEHHVNNGQLNLLAAVAELTGGQIRNAVLRGAVDAGQDGKRILYEHLLSGVATEYRKLSRQLPNELKQAQAAAQSSSSS